MNDDPSEVATMLNDIEQRSDRLTDWETHFIDEMSRRLQEEFHFSENQLNKIEQIWNKVTNDG